MVRDEELHGRAEELRVQGKSYGEISLKLGVAKSTLSGWFSGRKWSRETELRLKRYQEDKGRRWNLEMSRRKGLLKAARHERYRQIARKEYQKLKRVPLFVSGISIYWGEGEKMGRGRVSVVNSNAKMMGLVANFYRYVLRISNERLRGALFLYKDINERRALDYWSGVTGVPKGQFIKTQVIKGRTSGSGRRVINGMCCVYFSSTEMSVKVREWITLFSSEMRERYSKMLVERGSRA